MSLRFAILAAATAAALAAPAAHAAVPGVNGRIVFERKVATNNTEILTTGAGAAAQRLTTRDGLDGDPVFSPDGSRIAFVSDRAGSLDVFVMNADGNGVTQLTSGTAENTDPTWSPDGTRLAFTSTRDGDEEVFVMGADGSAQTQLTANALQTFTIPVVLAPDGLTVLDPGGSTLHGHDREPAWSPGGTKITFVSDRVLGRGYDVYVMGADGTGERQLTTTRSSERDPSWSPDGSRIAFAGLNPVGSGISTIAAAGGAVQMLANDVSWDRDPSWSPDGSKIVYRSSFGPLGQGLLVMNTDGSGAVKLTSGSSDARPDWAPCPGCAPPGGATTTTPAPARPASKPGSSTSPASGPGRVDSWTTLLGTPGSAPVAGIASRRSLRLRARARGIAAGGVVRVTPADATTTPQSIRLLGVTTRGLGSCASRSLHALRRWLFDARGRGRPLYLVTDPKVSDFDRAGRLQAYVERTKPAELQLWLLSYGLAKVDRSAGTFRRLKEFTSAQQRAKRKHKGVWGHC